MGLSVSTRGADRSSRLTSVLPEHIPSLDGLRAISVLLVVAGHAALYAPDTGRQRLFSLLFLNAEIGVTWFFVISGFLITMLLLRERERTKNISLGKFYLRRALRILPPFYAFILVVLLLKYLGGLAVPGQRIWSAATFTYNVIKHPAWGGWWLGHSWSLSVEEQFYLCWPLLLIILDIRKARVAAVLLILLAPVFRLSLLVLYPQFANQISGLLPSRMDGLMLGALAALCGSAPWFQRWLSRLSHGVLCGAILFVFVLSPLLVYRLGNLYLFSAGLTLECVCLLLILLYGVYRPMSTLGRVLNAKPLVLIGVLSYDIYLWQQLFITPNNTTVTGLPLVNVVCVGLCALLSFRLIEMPCRRLSRRLLR